ncbi:hypothetical protein WSM22_03120 [Cytophagales bacterium WSM2-2]|nr:hypothetical protein WSM22_03120 [Cytophagales bacterium WSM2-2]
MTKELHIAWLRSSALFHTVHQQLEEELQRMREKKLPQDLIDKKDLQIQSLVEYFNNTDELVQAYRLLAANRKLETILIMDIMTKQMNIRDFLDYKPNPNSTNG